MSNFYIANDVLNIYNILKYSLDNPIFNANYIQNIPIEINLTENASPNDVLTWSGSNFYLAPGGGGTTIVESLAGTRNQILINSSTGVATGPCQVSFTNGISIGDSTYNSPTGGIYSKGQIYIGTGFTGLGHPALLVGISMTGPGTMSNVIITGGMSGTSSGVIYYGMRIATTYGARSTNQTYQGISVNPSINASGIGSILEYNGINCGSASFTSVTPSRAFSIRAVNPSAGTVRAAILADNMLIGTTSASPPSSGMIVVGQVGIGTTSVLSNYALTVSGQGSFSGYLSGGSLNSNSFLSVSGDINIGGITTFNRSGVDFFMKCSSDSDITGCLYFKGYNNFNQYNVTINGAGFMALGPTKAGFDAIISTDAVIGTFFLPGPGIYAALKMIPNFSVGNAPFGCYGIYMNPSIVSTMTNYIGIYSTSTYISGSVNNAYHGYFENPSFGNNIRCAVYAANLSVGYNITPPNAGAVISGNVGIGTNNPQAKLDVQGTISTTGGVLFGSGGGILNSYYDLTSYTTYYTTTDLPGSNQAPIIFYLIRIGGTVSCTVRTFSILLGASLSGSLIPAIGYPGSTLLPAQYRPTSTANILCGNNPCYLYTASGSSGSGGTLTPFIFQVYYNGTNVLINFKTTSTISSGWINSLGDLSFSWVLTER